MGMSLALLVRAAYRMIAQKQNPGQAPERTSGISPIFSLFLFLTFLLGRACLDYYSPFVFLLPNYPWQDLMAGYQVSANFAMYLALLAGLHLLGPLYFILLDLNLRALLPAPVGWRTQEHEKMREEPTPAIDDEDIDKDIGEGIARQLIAGICSGGVFESGRDVFAIL